MQKDIVGINKLKSISSKYSMMLYDLLYYLNHDEEREILCIERERLKMNMILL